MPKVKWLYLSTTDRAQAGWAKVMAHGTKYVDFVPVLLAQPNGEAARTGAIFPPTCGGQRIAMPKAGATSQYIHCANQQTWVIGRDKESVEAAL